MSCFFFALFRNFSFLHLWNDQFFDGFLNDLQLKILPPSRIDKALIDMKPVAIMEHEFLDIEQPKILRSRQAFK